MISYSIHNGGKSLKCVCGKLFDIEDIIKCPVCNQTYRNDGGYILRNQKGENINE